MKSGVIPTMLLALLVSTLASCDKLKSVAAKFEKKKSEEASTSAKPAVQASYRRDQISEITSASYDGFISRKSALVVVDFHAEWCGPCKMLGPVLAKATELHPGVVYLGKVDVDQASDLAQKNGVSSIPDVRIFKDGKEIERFVGFPGEQAVLAKIAKHSEGIQPAAPAEVAQAADAGKPTVKQFEKGWLPPGMSRKGETAPAQPKQP